MGLYFGAFMSEQHCKEASRPRVASDSLRLENAWCCCVVADLSLSIYAHLHDEFPVLTQCAVSGLVLLVRYVIWA